MDIETLRKIVSYDPFTGEMRWLSREGVTPSIRSWNTRYAGKLLSTIDGKGYIHFMYMGTFYRVHRVAWLYMTGEIPNVIDHINGDRADNRFSNLTNTSIAGNSINRRLGGNNTSGVVGVYFNKKSNLWCAQIKFKNKTRHLGSSTSFFDAVCMRKREERLLGFSLRHGENKQC